MVFIVPSWLTILMAAALPVSEVRGAIPLAIGYYGYSWDQAFIISVLGNLLPVVPLLLFLGPVSDYLRRYSLGDKFFTWLFARTRSRYIQKHESFGLIALTLFVAVPFPLTGAWTGCAIAFLLGFRFLPALGAVATGVLIAAGIVTATVMGAKILIF
ncbi:COG2426 family protein [Methanothrix sp.]|uniref:COG2426 family protein n=1 Tax=Methanothrix sp. TaxID=90426 RepID=UPI003C74CE64